jgi:hypothetical protein
MDVSATGESVAAAAQTANVETIMGSVPEASGHPVAPAQIEASSISSGVGAIPPTQTTPAPVPGSDERSTLASTVAKLFAIPSAPAPVSLDVSYRVERDPDVIVTVFSDPKTGEEVAQFPPEILINLSQFFDQPRGVTLDRNA